jgi:hypothetical protein
VREDAALRLMLDAHEEITFFRRDRRAFEWLRACVLERMWTLTDAPIDKARERALVMIDRGVELLFETMQSHERPAFVGRRKTLSKNERLRAVGELTTYVAERRAEFEHERASLDIPELLEAASDAAGDMGAMAMHVGLFVPSQMSLRAGRTLVETLFRRPAAPTPRVVRQVLMAQGVSKTNAENWVRRSRAKR